ncbi:MAG TPA: nicotinate-nucleotide adenylyltransferase [Burkholderiales bacterium]|nr:nicotinate-nucleotide adenylyltransferase [Burkholderiales bacterium]
MSTGPIGIFGGTFDPIHYGHLRLAEEVAESAKLAEVRFLPSGTPPHRARPGAEPVHRVEMARLATAGNDRFVVDDRETKRSGPGFTYDTLTELRHEVGSQRALVLLVGADAFLELATWHRWRALFDLAHIVVAYRPGFPIDSWQARMPEPLAHEYAARYMQQTLAVHLAPAGGIAAVSMTGLDISATFVRNAVHAGASPRYLLPDTVLDYIRTHDLYH